MKDTTTPPRRRGPHRQVRLCLFLVATIGSCFPPVEVTPPPASAPASLVALSGASVVLAVGDIARCASTADEATASLVDSVLRADSAAGVENVVVTMGDNVYYSGLQREFDQCWTPSWGDTNRLIMDHIRPSIGNHDLDAELGGAYFKVFGDRAGEHPGCYYSFELGSWLLISLNSEIPVHPAYSVDTRQKQMDWLEDQLSGTHECTLVYFHRPRFSSGGHAGDLRMTVFWRLLYEKGVDVVLVGHDHHYERFHPQTPAGLPDSARGITQFLVGTGGASLTGIRVPPAPNSARRVQGHHGVLKLTLGTGEYQHAFLDTQGRIWDQGAGRCH
jgi:hypothetical protein